MTEIRSIKSEASSGPWDPGLVDVLYITIFKYDEAGNRIRKTVKKYEGGDPDPVHEETGDNPGWHLVSDEYYVRDVSGKEIAIYSGSSLTQWNIWGLDNVGIINADTTRNYYLKDHLGSIRVVLNSTNQVISAQDYDAWGYPLENRTYNSTAMRYDFTGKERDDQTTYDYFGARYYDSRVANWTSIDPLFEKFFDFTPYSYVLDQPVNQIDKKGCEAENDWRYKNSNQLSQTAFNEIKLRISSGYSKLFSGDIEGAIQQGIDNAINSPGLLTNALDPNGINTISIGLANPIFIPEIATTTLYRSVIIDELKDIESFGGYRLKLGGVETKYFWTNMDDASLYSKMAGLEFDETYSITKVNIQSSLLKNPDVSGAFEFGSVKYYTIGNETLSQFPKTFPINPRTVNYSKIVLSKF